MVKEKVPMCHPGDAADGSLSRLQVNSLQTVCINVYKIFLLQAYRWVMGLCRHKREAQS
jgi:hypothetical protein